MRTNNILISISLNARTEYFVCATAGPLVQLMYASGSINTPMAATLTEAAGCHLAGWVELAWKRRHQGLASAAFSVRRVELGRKSSFGLSDWLSPTV